MEDAATAEISRSQVWQWVHAGRFTAEQVREEPAAVEAGDEARELFPGLASAPSWSSSSRFPRTLDSHERRLGGAHQGAEAPALPAPGAGMLSVGSTELIKERRCRRCRRRERAC